MNKEDIDKLKSIIKDKQKEYEEGLDDMNVKELIWATGWYEALQFALEEVEKLETTEEPDGYDEYGRAIKYVDDGRGD